MIKICFIGIIAALMALTIRQHKADFAVVLGIAAGGIIFFYILMQLTTLMDFTDGIIACLPIDNVYFTQLIKMIGVSYCAEISSNICKDAGYNSIAGQIETFAKICIVVMSLPGMYYFVEVLEDVW